MSPGPLREDWLLEVNACLQRSIGVATLRGSTDGAILDAVQDVPLPANRLEELVLGGLLAELAAGGRCTTPTQMIERVRSLGPSTVRRSGVPIAKRAALIVRDAHAHKLDVPALARSLASDETRLRRCFGKEYRMTLREYHLRSRVAAALHHLAAGVPKVGAVASLVGYSTEKNFYRAMRRFTGRTPGQLRTLAKEELVVLAGRMLP